MTKQIVHRLIVLLREQDRLDAGVRRPHLGQLHRVVVDEDDAIGADVPRAQDTGDRLRLRTPVRLHGEEAVSLQQQVRPGQRFFHPCGVVFTSCGHQNAGVGERLQHLLVQRMAVAAAVEVPGDAVGAGLADQAAPERVVQVGDDSFFRRRRPQQRRQHIRDGRGVRRTVGKS